MSVVLIGKIWSDAYFGQADKTKLLVALALADFANEDGFSFPSIDSLAKKARTSLRSVQEVCREMELDGMLSITIAGGRNGTNLYRLTPATVAPPRIGAALKAAEEAALGAALDCTQSVRKHQKPPRKRQEQQTLSLDENNVTANSTSRSMDGFEEFWELYPRKVGKGAAEKAWVAMKCATRILKITTTVKLSKQSEDWKGPKKYIPHPATWINRKGWEDELTPERSRAEHPINKDNDPL